MRVLLDLQPLQGPSAARGIGYYAAALAQALVDHARDHEVAVLLNGAVPAEDLLRARDRLPAGLSRHDVLLYPGVPPTTGARATPAADAAREAAIAASGADAVLLSSLFELADGTSLTVNEVCSSVPTAGVLYDLIPLTDLDRYKFRPHERAAYLSAVERLAHLDLLLSISDHSAREAARLLDRCPPVVTVHGAAPPLVGPRPPRDAPEPGFVLAVGRDEPRKDVRTAVLAFSSLPAAVRGDRAFVVVGPWGQEKRAALVREAVGAGLPADRLRFVVADDAELSWLYGRADLFVFPSLDEGLGLPPLEAMAAGTPVLLARSSSLVELTDDDRAFFRPGDVEDLRERMVSVLTRDEVRDGLLASGASAAQRFTWAATAARAWAALEELPRPARAGGGPLLLVDGGGSGGRVRAALAAGADVVVSGPDDVQDEAQEAWSAGARSVYAGLHGCEEELVLRPGVVLHDPEEAGDDGAVPAAPRPEVVAPAVAVLCPAPEAARALLAGGVTRTDVRLLPGDVTAAAVHDAHAADPLTHWVEGAAALGLDAQDAAGYVRRPLWSLRARPPVLGTDVTIYRSTPFLSGIQRTALRLHDVLRELLAPQGGVVVPLQLGETPDGVAHPALAADPVLASPVAPVDDVDWALCIDLNGHVMSAAAELTAARAAGTGLLTNVFDLLPWTHPEWWPPGAAEASFVPWLRHAVGRSDVLLVNSRATAADLERYLRVEPPDRPDGFQVHLVRLGSDFPAGGAPAPVERDPAHVLLVGTVEPRKGHRVVLDAVEALWRRGRDVRLTVVGRAGWLVDDLAARMRGLAAVEPRFTWLEGASDATLAELYATCTTAVVASEGEGFGLPVVEAAVRACPVLVHDIPVLRELAGPGATYFSAERPLVDVLDAALADPSSIGPVAEDAVTTWDAVGRRVLAVLDGSHPPLATWRPGTGWAWQS